MTIKELIRPIPGVRQFSLLRQRMAFRGSALYWERHYARGGTSGPGSYDVVREGKADFLNDFVRTQGVRSVIEFGCGDGHQLSLCEYPTVNPPAESSLRGVRHAACRLRAETRVTALVYQREIRLLLPPLPAGPVVDRGCGADVRAGHREGGVRLPHVEVGLLSSDQSMPGYINWIVTDRFSGYLFARLPRRSPTVDLAIRSTLSTG